MSKTIVKNVKLIPELTPGCSFSEADLVFTDNKISAIVPVGSANDPDASVFDGKGMTAMPGIIDAHIHLSSTRAQVIESNYISPCSRSFEALQFAQYLLGIGVTTVRDCGEDRDFSVIALRNAANEGIVKAPRIHCSGQTLCPTESGSLPDGEFGFMTPENIDGPIMMRKAVRMNFARGVDFIKLYGSGSMMAKGSKPGIPILEDDEISEAVRIAKQKGTYCAIHAHGTDAIDQALRLGCSTIEHASFIGDESIRRLSGREHDGIIPTLSVTTDIVKYTDPNTEYGKNTIKKVEVLMDDIKSHLGKAYENGTVLIGWGTDQSYPAYLREPGSEFHARHDYWGWSNLDLLKQATINSARIMRLENEIGTIEVGKYADVILIDGDPVKDISTMYGGAAHVFKDGELYK